MGMKWILVLLTAALLAGGAYAYVYRTAPSAAVAPETERTYARSDFGIAFSYPKSYVLTEREENGRYSIALIEHSALENTPEAGEGPTAITVELFENSGGESAEAWVRSATSSNFHLSNQNLAAKTVAGASAVAYAWDGLYRGESVVFAHRGRIIMLSVTYLTEEDQIRGDFDAVINSIKLQ